MRYCATFFLLLFFLPITLLAGDVNDLPLFRSREWQEQQLQPLGSRQFLTETMPLDGSIVVRVGSPFFNIRRNYLRLRREEGQRLAEHEQALLRIEEIEEVEPNTLLIFTYENDRPATYEGYLDTPDLEGWKLYLYKQGTGFAEIVLEDGVLYTVAIPLNYGVVGPILELVNALKSSSLNERFENSGLAIVDAGSGIVYAAEDVFSQLSEGDIARAIKAGLRVPLAALQLGGTVAVKTIRLPLDLIMAPINLGRRLCQALFGTGSESESEALNEIARALAEEFAAVQELVVDNNNYDVEMNLNNGDTLRTTACFHYESEGNFFDFTFVYPDGTETPNINPYAVPSTFRWSVLPAWGNDPASLTISFESYLNSSEKEIWLLIGTVEGTFDIDIEGFIVRKEDFDNLLNTEGHVTIASLRNRAIGRFHFDD